MRWRKAVLSVAVAVTAAGVGPLHEAGPAVAAGWSISLASSATDVEAGTSISLTATANQAVTGTGYFIDIFDKTTGSGVGFCTSGSTCRVSFTEAEARSHTFVAYIDNDPIFRYPPCCIQATSGTVTVRWYARATAAFDVGFAVSGSLPAFPCPTGCTAGFAGSGTGAGHAVSDVGGVQYSATLAVPNGVVSGSATYTEPGQPLCPAVGSATGTVTLAGTATGTVSRTSAPTAVGTVIGATFTLAYTYQRVGPTSVVTITGGTAIVHFTFPGTGAGRFVSNVEGGGPGVFEVDLLQAVDRCQAPRSLAFTFAGDVALSLT